ncbi:phage tail tape measure protein [Mycolicibacterium sp. Y3]
MAKTPTVGVAVTAKVDERALQKSEQQVLASSQKTGAKAATSLQKAFDAVRVDPAKMMPTQDYARQGAKAGKASGDSAAAAIGKGDFAGAATTAAREFSMTFEKRARPKINVGDTRRTGQSAGDEFADGFSGAAGILRLAGKGGPIATALIGGATAAIAVIRPMIQDAMQLQADIKLNQAKLGISDAQMASTAKAAGDAWSANFGESIAANMDTATTAIQSGLLKATDGSGKQTEVIEGLQTIKSILGEDIPEVSRSASQLLRTGLASDAKQAFDIITAGQREGLNVSGDWLDTIDEYSTQLRKLGLTGADAIGLLRQGLEGGARDTDIVADSIKEFSIRAVDGSKTTQQAFEALGLNATDTAGKLAQGGSVARDAFAEVLDRIRGIQDPLVQSKIAVALMGTQAEDLGAAFKKIDLHTITQSIKDVQGATQDAANTALKTSQNEWATAGRNIESMWNGLKQKLNLDGLFSGIPKAFNDLLADTPKLTPGAPGIPATGPRLQGPGLPGSITLPINGAPGVASGNPLDAITGGVTGTNFYKSWYAPAPTPPPPTQITPNALTDPSLADSGGGASDKLKLPTLPNTGPSPQDFLQQNGIPVTSGTFSAAQTVLESQQHIAQLQSDVNTLEKANVDDQGDLISKRNELLKASQDQTKALMSLQDSAKSATDSLTKTVGDAAGNLSDIGASLDKDLGLSKGLPGLADNLVKFIASLAAAPVMGALAPIAARGDGSYGLLGMAFGGSSQTASAAAQGMNVTANGIRSGYPGDQALLSQIRPGDYISQPGVGDLTKGIGDCTSSIEDLVNILDGRSTAGRSMSTGNAAEWLTGRGFVPGAGGPGDFRVAYSPSHMQATLPGGTPWNWGSQSAAEAGGVGGLGADDPSLPTHYYRPVAPAVPSIPQTGPAPSPVDIYGPANTDPALNNPLPPLGSLPGGGGRGPGNMPQALPFGTPYQSQGIDYQDPSWQPKGGGGLGIGGGLLGGAIQGAIGAAGSGGSMFGGQAAAAAAQMAMQAINRTIKFGGQAAGILTEGALDTFFPTNPDTGKNPMKDSWFWRAAGSLAGATPAIGSGGAGLMDKASNKKAAENQGNALQQNGQQSPQQSGPLLHIENFHGGDQSAKANAVDLAANLQAQTNEAQLARA